MQFPALYDEKIFMENRHLSNWKKNYFINSSDIFEFYYHSQKTRHIEPMLGQSWPAVYDVGPTVTQHVQCLVFAE